MAGASFKKLMNYILGDEDTQEEYDEEEYNADYQDEYEAEEENEGEALSIFKRKNKVVSMPQPQQITQLKEKNAVVLNLEYVSKDVARRIVDVVSGAVKALDGNIEKVSNSILVIAPYNYDIINEISKEKIENRFSASWIK